MITKSTFITCVVATCAIAGAASLPAQPANAPALFDRSINEARASAGKSYKEPTIRLPGFLKDLSYDAYLDIHARREKALWHQDGKFEVQFFHPGYLYQSPVGIRAVENGRETEIKFDPGLFDYGKNKLPEPVPRDLYFAGLRLLYPLNQPSKMDELAIFLGSSYFRFLGAHQFLGTSLRGLAIDTAESSGEEFPQFTDFWIEKPGPSSDQIRLFARLESRRASGAYQFLITPGDSTVVEVQASIFLRSEVKKLGLAPLTSMFLFAESRTRYFPDFRPEIHDADGLLMETANGSWEWRPLINPAKVHQVTTFPSGKGFGLVQRDRDWESYADLQANYEHRASYWIVREGDWGPGRLELVEIPSTEERHDNMVAYWVPDRKPAPGQELRFRYKIYSQLNSINHPPGELLRVQATRLQVGKDRRTRFVIDFTKQSLATSTGPAPVGKVQANKARIENVVTQENKMLGGWRVFFDAIPEANQTAEVRAWLHKQDQICSEVWVYHLTDQ
ncbi:MAG TPA: glucan biosynthesis protein G [Verrucomicrobiae bacterium]|nr:glucan biosynthesis protein G [Verrucomicrobiae bacterium]